MSTRVLRAKKSFSRIIEDYTIVASWTLVVLYEYAAVGVLNTPPLALANDNFFYVSANLIGMFSSYHRELYMRREFYQGRIIRSMEEERHVLEKASLRATRDKAVKSLEESEKKFRTLAETAAMAIFIHQGGNFLYANPAAEIIGGYSVSEYLALNFMSLVHPDYVDLVRTRARERLGGRGGVPPQYEFKILRKNGEERWVLMTGGITEFEGKPSVIGTLIDITERKKAEEERQRINEELQRALRSLQESETRFRTLAETTAAGIFIYREERLVYVNPAGVRFSGYEAGQLLGMNFWEFIHPDYRTAIKKRAAARLRGEAVPPDYEFKIMTKSGDEHWMDMTAGVTEYEGKPAVIATLFDVTDRKQAEAEKMKLYEQRISEEKRHRLEKEAILMDLHDGIGGITTNISILSELAQQLTDMQEVKKKLETITRLSREGISEIRGFMRGLDSQELSWRTLAAELRGQGTALLEPHAVSFDLESRLLDGFEPPGSLMWVNVLKIFKEALTNVVKHSKARAVAVKLRVSENAFSLAIQDDGVGVQPASGGGRGIANMKRRAKEVGGMVTVSTERGTLVRVEIPLPLKYPDPGIEL
jgi:PAS domain S-box-containing protein